MQTEPTPDEKNLKRRRAVRKRVLFYGGFLALLWGAYVWQPIEIDFIPRKVPPFVKVDPDSKHLFEKGTRVMVITAHPDDSEFYAAGTLLQLAKSGAELHHLLLTDGDKAFYFWADNSALRFTRRTEQRTASGKWNAREVRFLGYPDGRLRKNAETIAKTAAAIKEWNPEYILCFDPNYPPRQSHQDHRRSGEIAFAAGQQAGFKGWYLCFSSIAPNYAVDVDKVWSDRLDMIAIHASQFSGKKLEMIRGMFAESAANQGEPFGYSFAESYRAVQSP